VNAWNKPGAMSPKDRADAQKEFCNLYVELCKKYHTEKLALVVADDVNPYRESGERGVTFFNSFEGTSELVTWKGFFNHFSCFAKQFTKSEAQIYAKAIVLESKSVIPSQEQGFLKTMLEVKADLKIVSKIATVRKNKKQKDDQKDPSFINVHVQSDPKKQSQLERKVRYVELQGSIQNVSPFVKLRPVNPRQLTKTKTQYKAISQEEDAVTINKRQTALFNFLVYGLNDLKDIAGYETIENALQSQGLTLRQYVFQEWVKELRWDWHYADSDVKTREKVWYLMAKDPSHFFDFSKLSALKTQLVGNIRRIMNTDINYLAELIMYISKRDDAKKIWGLAEPFLKTLWDEPWDDNTIESDTKKTTTCTQIRTQLSFACCNVTLPSFIAKKLIETDVTDVGYDFSLEVQNTLSQKTHWISNSLMQSDLAAIRAIHSQAKTGGSIPVTDNSKFFARAVLFNTAYFSVTAAEKTALKVVVNNVSPPVPSVPSEAPTLGTSSSSHRQ
jgi:hypothetical protein